MKPKIIQHIKQFFAKANRIRKKPFAILYKRFIQEINGRIEKQNTPLILRLTSALKLAKKSRITTLTDWWIELSNTSFLIKKKSNLGAYEKKYSVEETQLYKKATRALAHQVNLLGTGLIDLGKKIDWHQDYKTGKRWAPQFHKDIEYTNLDEPSDVKIPWEISRMQWLIPAAQAYMLTQDDTYAAAIKAVLLDWIKENPYAYSVNWACTMEVALRIIVWIFFFECCSQSPSWQDSDFQSKFLQTLYLHGRFAAKNLEESDINGNHFTADLAGLVFAGLFFEKHPTAKKWHDLGWNRLQKEIFLQTSLDGVDFEGSVPYHRLVLELFFLPALYREKHGLETPENYKQHILKMARFVAHYVRPDGSAPLIGDADDARVLPLGNQHMNDHTYLPALIAAHWEVNECLSHSPTSFGEIFWLLGEEGVNWVIAQKLVQKKSLAFPDGGYFIMQNDSDHIFIDCAPVGQGGRGGHGHNDCLSFEAFLENELLIVDSGAYVYTASYKERNAFRSTRAHNTILIDNEEINRFIDEKFLWTLENDAKPILLEWEDSPERTRFKGSHTGYQRLKNPVSLTRTVELNHLRHKLKITDKISSSAEHCISIVFHFAPHLSLSLIVPNILEIKGKQSFYQLSCCSDNILDISLDESEYSESYGVKTKNKMLICKFYAGRTSLETRIERI